MEYVSDLNVWYKASYGSDFNTEFGCPMIRDMVEKFRYPY